MAVREIVGERFYLFREAGRRADHLIIYSHGGYFPWTTRFKVPAETTLYFYGPDRQTLAETNYNITRVVAGARHFEVMEAGAPVRDYSLSKFYLKSPLPDVQNLPPGRRTYELILAAIDGVRQQIAQQEAAHAAGIPLPHEMEVLPRMDIMTVRNRSLRCSVGLHDAVRAGIGLGYRRFHCYFCRSPTITLRSPENHWLDANLLEFPH